MNRFFRWFTLSRVLTILPFLALIAFIAPPVDTDVYWHLSAGRWQVENRAFLLTDVFSSTLAGQAWINHGAPVQVILYLLFDSLGYLGLSLFMIVNVLIAMGFVYQTTTGDRFTRSITILLVGMASAIFWVPRPLMVSYALSGVLFLFIYRFQQGQIKHIWWVIPGMIIWSNIHGAASSGFILLVMATGGEFLHWFFIEALPAYRSEQNLSSVPRPVKFIHLTAVGLLSALGVTFLNLHGTAMITYPFFTINMDAAREFIVEWASPDFHTPATQPFLWMLIAMMVLLGTSKEKLTWKELVYLVLGTYGALKNARLITTFAMVSAPIFSRHLDGTFQNFNINLDFDRPVRSLPEGILNSTLIFMLGLAMLVFSISRSSHEVLSPLLEETLPIEATSILLEENPQGRLLNSYNWGGYLTYYAGEYPVYIDGRADLYGDDLIFHYLSLYFAQDSWEETLKDEDIDIVFLETSAPLARVLAEKEEWDELYSDKYAVIYTRTE